MAYYSMKLAQIFNVYGTFTPTKVSAYLKPVNCGLDTGYFSISDSSGIVVSALNFSKIDQGDRYLIGLDDTTQFDGEGFLTSISPEFSPSISPVSYYPISVDNSLLGTYRIWLRARSTAATINMDILLNNTVVATINSVVADSSWAWYSADFDITDSTVTDLKIRFNVTGISLDKWYLSSAASSITPVGATLGPSPTTSPYLTISANIYPVDEDNNFSAPLAIYDYKTTIDGVIADDWYNFDINFLDRRYAVDFDGRYALVLYTSGSDNYRYILWELVENDEYICGPSAFKYNI